jgi:hypothetical protein
VELGGMELLIKHLEYWRHHPGWPTVRDVLGCIHECTGTGQQLSALHSFQERVIRVVTGIAEDVMIAASRGPDMWNMICKSLLMGCLSVFISLKVGDQTLAIWVIQRYKQLGCIHFQFPDYVSNSLETVAGEALIANAVQHLALCGAEALQPVLPQLEEIAFTQQAHGLPDDIILSCIQWCNNGEVDARMTDLLN